ncbi:MULTISPECIES: flagellar basal body rod protein FlgC [Novosphingobium]|uniref:Flagellar basal-body rod protein FlgC n=2 Tax=Novosphingobium TaxID=165696 RepID=A0ABT0AGB2_9SPHN|nr:MULTISPECIES: flagellar basal body rod protein FlgC [Novosphingobium]MCJ1962228.1 flagellar basal body rod protein FlgC [Novosphingobium mangrovi (ex Hu et al. 2023)]MED5544401.1 flagellar basal body rod protein FlgC [Pseudomonadota bacterium]QVM85365.1 flagellar basal body rod protein FlgC [Novosphingobium decolorationis]GAM03390.1 flagellar basal-body rod protein FlgC [Novosphingobium sp. MBES04]
MANSPMTLFTLAQRGMSAQMVRMNAAASNLANAGTVSASEGEAYKPIRPVFAADLDAASGLASVDVRGVVRENAAALRQHTPEHPLADANGDVWAAPVDENAEMVEMLEASRQYQNLLEALSTAKQLMLETMRLK